MSFDSWLEERLGALERAGLLRRDDGVRPGSWLDASSNDYLGFRRTVSRATPGVAPGAGASRLIFGTQPEHIALEQALADWVCAPTALLFSSGYAANVGLLGALAEPGQVILSDALNHASIVDGCRLARAEVRVTPHRDLNALQTQLARAPRPAIVVTESYFSMDGDSPDLLKLAELCQIHDAFLVVDEAHALGVYGPSGAGLCAAQGVRPHALVGTLGKAVGAQGAFVAGSDRLRDWLWNRARSFVFSTAPSPALAALALQQVERARAADQERRQLELLSTALRVALRARGLRTLPDSHGPIVAVLAPDPTAAVRAENALAAAGILARAIRPPTVPAGTQRLRLSAHADWHETDPGRIAEVIAQAWK